MRKRMVYFISLVLIVIAASAFIVYKQVNKFSIPKIEDINSIAVSPDCIGLDSNGFLDFDLNKKEDLDMVNNILNWLKAGKLIDNKEISEYVDHAFSPAYLIIELKDGTTIRIQSANDAIATRLGNQLLMDKQDIPDCVTIYFSDREPVREISPQLKSFITVGWRSFFNYSKR